MAMTCIRLVLGAVYDNQKDDNIIEAARLNNIDLIVKSPPLLLTCMCDYHI